MKYLFIVFLLVGAVGFSADFRSVNFGMSKKDVIKNEKALLVTEHDNSLIYDVKIVDNKFDLIYTFQNDKLIQAQYFCAEKIYNAEYYVEVYKKLKVILDKKYGPGKEIIVMPERYKNSDDLSIPIKAGFVQYSTAYKKDSINILLKILPVNTDATVIINYTHDKYVVEDEL